MKKAFTGTIQVEIVEGVDLGTAVREAKVLLYSTKADKIIFDFNGVWLEVDEVHTMEDVIAEYHSNFS